MKKIIKEYLQDAKENFLEIWKAFTLDVKDAKKYIAEKSDYRKYKKERN